MDSINSFINQIKNSQTIAIFTHINPDGDTLGSATGLKNFITTNFDNKDVTLVVCSEIPEVFGFLPGIKDVVHYSKIDETTIFDLAIATDVAAKDRMGVALTFFEKAKSKINIDHHITNNEYLDCLKGLVNATIALNSSFLRQLGVKVTLLIRPDILYNMSIHDNHKVRHARCNTYPWILE